MSLGHIIHKWSSGTNESQYIGKNKAKISGWHTTCLKCGLVKIG